MQLCFVDWELHVGGTSEQDTLGGNDRCGRLFRQEAASVGD